MNARDLELWLSVPLATRVETTIGLMQNCGGADGVYALRDAVMAEVQPEIDRTRAAALREAINKLDEKILAIAVGSGPPEQQPDDRISGLCAAVGILRRVADASAAGKDTREGESTQPAHAPSLPGTCARARGTYDWAHGTTPTRETPCRPYPELHCVASCLDSEGGGA